MQTNILSKISLLKIFAIFSTFATTSLLVIIPTSYAWYQPPPSFGFCPNPGGQQVASYNNGYHWIVGNSVLQWGTDAVYSKGNNNYTQCYCPLTQNNQPTGKLGTQTYWWFAGQMPQEEKEVLRQSGWIDVSNGSAFGLASGEYLAKNMSSQCGQPISCSSPSHNQTAYKEYDQNVHSYANNHSITIHISHTPHTSVPTQTQYTFSQYQRNTHFSSPFSSY